MVRLLVLLTIALFTAMSALASPSDNAKYANAALRALNEPPIEQLSSQGADIVRLLRGSDHHWPGFSVRIDVRGDRGTLTVRRFRSNHDSAGGFDLLGTRDLSAQDMTALYQALDRVHFWQLAPEEDLEEMAQKVPQPQPQNVDGKTYEPNQPLMVICSDAAVLGLEVIRNRRVHKVYRSCSNDINDVANQLIDLAQPLLHPR